MTVPAVDLDDPEPQPKCCTCIDSEWLLLCGEQLEQVAARLHMSDKVLYSHLRRHGRLDLWRMS